MPSRLQEIDELTIGEHWYLESDDHCFYLREWTKGGWSASETNQLIHNLKKDMSKRGTFEFKHKTRAIKQCSDELREALGWTQKEDWIVVPVPPSKAKNHPDYDDRMVQIAQQICKGTGAGCLELIVQVESREASHLQTINRDRPEVIAANYAIDKSLRMPKKPPILVLDDVLTAGSHFKACQSVLVEHFPDALVCGLFVARRRVLESES